MNMCEEKAMQCLKACGLAEADGSLTKDCRRLMVVFESEKLRGILDEQTRHMVAAMIQELLVDWQEEAICNMLRALYKELDEPCPDFRAMEDAGVFLPEFFDDLCFSLLTEDHDENETDETDHYEGADEWV